MEKRKLGQSGLYLSELGLGTMQFGWTADEPTSFALMDQFMQAGGNFIDTADIYTNWAGPAAYGGKTEEIIGRWMKDRKNRDQVVIATKVRGTMWEGADGEGLSRRHIMRACEDSLRRLQIDTIDFYQCHWADLTTPIDETIRALDDLVRQGKVQYLGASNYPAWRLMEALNSSERQGCDRFISYQPQWSLVERSLFEYEAMPCCRHHGLGVVPYSPLAGGFLTGKYRKDQTVQSVRAEGNLERYGNDAGWALLELLDTISKENGKTISQTALAWLLTQPVCTAPIVGANNSAQLAEALGAVGYRLSDAQMKALIDLTAYPKNWRPIWD